jgi:tetratricopeptide (TPR) repeat protein
LGVSRSSPATRTERLVIALIFLFALLLRFLQLQEIRANDPFFTIPSVDGQIYHGWAQQIASGHLLWDQALILGPLYPFFMGLVYAVFGTSLPALKAIQIVLGAANCVLLWALARELFDRRVALLAALMLACYGMMIFFEGTVMLVNLQVPLVLSILLVSVRALREPTTGRWVLCGLLVGFSTLARQNALLYVPLILGWLLWYKRDRLTWKRRGALAAAFCGAMFIVISPVTLGNYLAEEDLVLINASGGWNLYIGNYRGSDGTWNPPPLDGMRTDSPRMLRAAFSGHAKRQMGRELKPSEISSYWIRRTLDEIKASPSRWLALEWDKLLLSVNAWEVWSNRSYTIARGFSRVLRLPLLGFGLMAPLALVGLALTVRRWRELFPLYAMLAVYLASTLALFVLARFRMVVVPVLMIFAAQTVVRVIEAVRARQIRVLAGVLAGLVAASLVVHLDRGSEDLYMAYYNLGNKYKSLERWDEAIGAFQRSLELNPRFISTYNNLALAYEGTGSNDAEAIALWRQILQWSQRSGDERRIERARRHLATLGAISPGEGGARNAPP